MKTSKLFWVLMGGCLAMCYLTSCSKDDVKNPPGPTPDTEILIEQNLPDMDTKVELNDSERFAWQTDDALSVCYIKDDVTVEKNAKFNIASSSVGYATGKFTNGSVKWGEGAQHVIYTVYPYSDGYTDLQNGNVPVEIPSVQTDLDKAFMMWFASAEFTTVQEIVKIDATSPTAFLSIDINADGTPLSGLPVSNIILTSDNGIVGSATYDIKENKAAGFTEKTISLDARNKTVGSSAFTFAMYPQDLSSHKLSLSLASPVFDAVIDLTNEIGELTELNTTGYTIDLQDAIEADRVTITYKGEISSDEANSYIIPPGEMLILPVSTAYNAWETRPELLENPLTNRTGEAQVKILWIDNNLGLSPDGTIASYFLLEKTSLRESGIGVLAGSETGNALVALYIGDEIVWSWHIWVTDYDPEVQNGTIEGVVVMDRNLGALTNEFNSTGAMGLHYEWGRKDPFQPSDDNINPEYQKPNYDIYGEIVPTEAVHPQYADEKSCIRYAIHNPATYVYNPYDMQFGSFGSWTSNDIIYPYEHITDLWNNTDSSKTVYDPCPKGWRVPNQYDMFDNFTNSEGFEPGSGFILNGIYFPACGLYSSYGFSITEVGSETVLWFGGVGGYGSRALEVFAGGGLRTPTSNALYRAYGANVRCVKE